MFRKLSRYPSWHVFHFSWLPLSGPSFLFSFYTSHNMLQTFPVPFIEKTIKLDTFLAYAMSQTGEAN
jgi:hypothetical protein